MAGRVGGLRKHPHGRVDQLEDRYLGMVEALKILRVQISARPLLWS